MTDKITIARPYAKAAFDEAQGAKQLGQWADALRTGAAVVEDPRVEQLLCDPRVTPAKLADFVIGIATNGLAETGQNFVRTLAENRRLGYLPEISVLFNELKDQAEGIVDVTVTSAAPLDANQQQALSAALQRKLKRSVRLHCETNPSLIGGAVLQAGDLVIDGSLRSRLDRIAYELTA